MDKNKLSRAITAAILALDTVQQEIAKPEPPTFKFKVGDWVTHTSNHYANAAYKILDREVDRQGNVVYTVKLPSWQVREDSLERFGGIPQ